jgi:peptidoglycan/xylan/chitin deacetylase (PgdA/CDA1 family)
MDLEQAIDDLEHRRELPPRATALTFDDGYRDNLTIAAPILASLGLPATFFVVPGLLSHEPLAWWEMLGAAFRAPPGRAIVWRNERLSLEPDQLRTTYGTVCAALKRMRQEQRLAEVEGLIALLEPAHQPDINELFLDWDDALEMIGQGFKIGSHSLDHMILANEPPDVQVANLTRSREQLEARLNVAVNVVAYPNGTATDFDQTTERAAELAGYRGAITTVPGWNSDSTPRYRLHRFVLYPERGLRTLVRLGGLSIGNRLHRDERR